MPAASPARGPGPVAWAHRLLIAAALVCALVYAGWEGSQYLETGAPSAAGRAVLAFVVSIGIGLYLRSLRRLGARLTPRSRRS
jgi:hypothetical protein